MLIVFPLIVLTYFVMSKTFSCSLFILSLKVVPFSLEEVMVKLVAFGLMR